MHNKAILRARRAVGAFGSVEVGEELAANCPTVIRQFVSGLMVRSQKQFFRLCLLGSIQLLVLLGCGRDSTDSESSAGQHNVEDQARPDTLAIFPPETTLSSSSLRKLSILGPVGIWRTDWDEVIGHQLVVAKELPASTTASELISEFNQTYPPPGYPGLDLTSVRGDTAFVKVSEARQLTQQMGSEGAFSYLASATFTITSTDSIRVVFFDFPYGDHAMPGYYSRPSWYSLFPSLDTMIESGMANEEVN